jgi:hypothetical protein
VSQRAKRLMLQAGACLALLSLHPTPTHGFF